MKYQGVNIFQNLSLEKFPNFLGSGEEFDEIQFQRVVTSNLVLTTWRETFLNVKRNSTQLKGIVSHDEVELNANYPKMSQFTRTPDILT